MSIGYWIKQLTICLVLGSLFLYGQFAGAEEKKGYSVYSGIGLTWTFSNKKPIVSSFYAGGAAEKSGKIFKGDQLLSVESDGTETKIDDMTMNQIISLIRGPVGTKVTLKIARDGQEDPISVELTRAVVQFAEREQAVYSHFIGKPFPEFELSPYEGDTIKTNADVRGKIVVLEFWASWCPPCKKTVSELQAIAVKHPEWAGKVEMIAVSVDSDPDKAEAEIEANQWDKIQQYYVDFDTANEAGISFIPVVAILDKDGNVVVMAHSYDVDYEKEINDLLKP